MFTSRKFVGAFKKGTVPVRKDTGTDSKSSLPPSAGFTAHATCCLWNASGIIFKGVTKVNPQISVFPPKFPKSGKRGQGKPCGFPRLTCRGQIKEFKSFSAGHPPEGPLLPRWGNSPSAPAENSLTQPPWAASTSPQTGEGDLKGGQRPPLYFRSTLRCSSSRRGPWWRRRRRSGYTGPWRRRASPSRWRPSERCSCRSASRGRRTPCRWGSG